MTERTTEQEYLIRNEWQNAEPGVTRRLVAVGEEMTAMEVRFEAGAEGSLHSHPNEQVTRILEGRFTFTIAGQDLEVSAGDTVRIPGDAQHGVIAHEQGRLLDVFAPPREDLLAALL